MAIQAALFDAFRGPIRVTDLPEWTPHEDAVLIEVKACGICRSDWHAWMGHDSEVQLPHVPGHELSGIVRHVGGNVRSWQPGDRVTTPFCCGCGTCGECLRGNTHICDHYTQPGFTHWGAFAEVVEVRHADVNLVALPDAVGYIEAASLGCRFATSFRALVHQAKTRAGEWVVIHGCGGVGLSAIMIARALGALVIAVDVQADRLEFAKRLGAHEVIDAGSTDVVQRVREVTRRGADVSMDALGNHTTCWNSIACLGKRGRHVQVGLMLGDQANPPIPMSAVIANELKIYGSHGMQSVDYPSMLNLISRGLLTPSTLVLDTVSLAEGADILQRFATFPNTGITVIDFAI